MESAVCPSPIDSLIASLGWPAGLALAGAWYVTGLVLGLDEVFRDLLAESAPRLARPRSRRESRSNNSRFGF